MEFRISVFIVILLVILVYNTSVSVRKINSYNRLASNKIDDVYKSKKVRVTAHRGDSFNYPENTLSAILGAKELKADWIEIDVRETLDKKLVVIHDRNLKRTTGIDREVYETTYNEIKDYNAGQYLGKKENIPLLDQVLQKAKKLNLKLYIELKIQDRGKSIIQNIVDLIDYYEFQYDCVIISFDYDIIRELKMSNPHIKTGVIMEKADYDIDKFEYADEFSINAKFINKSIVDKIHLQNKKISAWTVDSEEDIIRMINLEVDNIVTNNIKLVKEIINNEIYDL